MYRLLSTSWLWKADITKGRAVTWMNILGEEYSHCCFKTVVNLFLEDIRMIIQKWISSPPNSDPLVKLLCFQASELVQQVKAFAMQGLWHEFNPENPQKAKCRGGHLEPQHSCGHTESRQENNPEAHLPDSWSTQSGRNNGDDFASIQFYS